MGNRKFYFWVYVFIVGVMRVYVYRDVLVFFVSKEYFFFFEMGVEGLEGYLMNMCLQGELEYNDFVCWFWDLSVDDLLDGQKERIWEQVRSVMGEVFEVVVREMMVYFQLLEQGFEVWGVDFLVDGKENVWLLEVNSFLDFKQMGRLMGVVEGFWRGVVDRVVRLFVMGEEGEEVKGMELVREVDLGRRFQSWGVR